MRKQEILRTVLFVVFFGVGATALTGAILCDDLVRYYHNKQLMEKWESSLRQLEKLNTDYDVLLKQLAADPNLITQLAPATLGTEPASHDAVYPKGTAEQLAAVKAALAKRIDNEPNEPTMPQWLKRSSEPGKRRILFLAGAVLVLVSFVWFGPVKGKARTRSS